MTNGYTGCSSRTVRDFLSTKTEYSMRQTLLPIPPVPMRFGTLEVRDSIIDRRSTTSASTTALCRRAKLPNFTTTPAAAHRPLLQLIKRQPYQPETLKLLLFPELLHYPEQHLTMACQPVQV